MNIQWVAFYTLFSRETSRIFRIWSQTLLPSHITVMLYFLIFGHVMGARVGMVSGVSYSSFIAPGLILMSIINNAYANVSNSLFTSKFVRNIEEMLVSSMALWILLVGFLSGGILRGLLVGAGVACVSLFFAPLKIYSYFYLTSIVLLTAIIFSSLGFLNALYAKKFDDVTFIPTFVITPLIYLGGIFYSVEMLPPFWRKISYFNPILSMVDIFRYSLLGISQVPVHNALLALCGVSVVLLLACYWCLHKGYGIQG